MTIHRRSRLGTLAVIFVILAALSVKAGTVGQMITALRLEKIWIDQTRFPDSVMFSLMNVELSRLAHEDMAYEKTAIIPLDDTLYDWALPVGTYAVAAVILNVDHNAKASEQVIKALTYVRPQDIGQKFTYGKGRPSQWSIWSDTLRLDQRTTTLMDTLIVRYWSEVDSVVTDTTQNIPIRMKYLVMLFDRMLEACANKLIFPGIVTPNAGAAGAGGQTTQSTTPAGKPTESNK